MDSYSTNMERDLLEKVARGDEKAFARLFEQYSDSTFGFALAYLKVPESAEEVVQEVFLKLWLGRERLVGVQSFRDHLFIVSRNHLFDSLRKKIREKEYRRQLARHFNHNTPTPHEELLLKESRERIGKAIAALPPQQQTIYRLRRNEGLPLADIALKLNISRLTVRNHLNKALGTIREQLER